MYLKINKSIDNRLLTKVPLLSLLSVDCSLFESTKIPKIGVIYNNVNTMYYSNNTIMVAFVNV